MNAIEVRKEGKDYPVSIASCVPAFPPLVCEMNPGKNHKYLRFCLIA